jgi:hypothetical protein
MQQRAGAVVRRLRPDNYAYFAEILTVAILQVRRVSWEPRRDS